MVSRSDLQLFRLRRTMPIITKSFIITIVLLPSSSAEPRLLHSQPFSFTMHQNSAAYRLVPEQLTDLPDSTGSVPDLLLPMASCQSGFHQYLQLLLRGHAQLEGGLCVAI